MLLREEVEAGGRGVAGEAGEGDGRREDEGAARGQLACCGGEAVEVQGGMGGGGGPRGGGWKDQEVGTRGV